MLIHVDDLLAIRINTIALIQEVAVQFKLKKDMVALSEIYLGVRLVKLNSSS